MVFEASGQFCLTGVWHPPAVSVGCKSGPPGRFLEAAWLGVIQPLIEMGEVPGTNFGV